jgi:FlaA1/EpsC-like NDP-sugar epimerase
MGEQIRLVDFARNLIRLAGLVPDQDVAIRFIGLRPGEKLSEELIAADELSEPTAVSRIARVRGGPRIDSLILEQHLAELVRYAASGDSSSVIQQLRGLIPTFEPTGMPVTLTGPLSTRVVSTGTSLHGISVEHASHHAS